ncbi:MAG: hypothetical protein ACXW0S_12035 [Solirubrobacterales bacterium]
MEATTTNDRKLLDERNIAERQLSALINAIRVHERAQWTKPYPRRTDDLDLYRRVRQILGEEA